MSLVQEADYGTPRSKAEKEITLTIDGMQVSVPEGTSIMRAAMEMGTQIPKLCATDMVDAFGSCRMCLVEIEGRPGTPASCTTPVSPDMVVKTQTERLKTIRKGVMELYISDHPLDCLTCAANGDCETAGHGRCGRPSRRALWLRRREPCVRQDGRRCQ
jgi:formate dehydrogenase major subunit